MRYCMTLYLKRYQKYDESKLKHLDLLNKMILEISLIFSYLVDRYLIMGWISQVSFFKVQKSNGIMYIWVVIFNVFFNDVKTIFK